MKNVLQVWRTAGGLTQEELAREVGVTRQTINAVEIGKQTPRLKLAFKLADYFGCGIEDIFYRKRSR